MRLTTEEINYLIKAIAEFLGKNSAELRLFGSRVDDRLKGGDIDLLLLVNNAEVKNKLNAQKHLILARIKELIGEQKIDLKITELSETNRDPFLQIVYPQSLSLNIW